MKTKIDFIGGNTKRCLMAMALPMIAAMFLNMMYNLVDSLWIGNLLGETAYAALTNSTPIILILTYVAMGATNGISILLSQVICLLFMLFYLKKKKLFAFKLSAFDGKEVLPLIQKAIPSVIQQSIPAFSTTFLSVIVVGFSKQLSILFVRSAGVADIVGNYFLIVSIGYILNTVTNCCFGTINGMGRPSKSMLLMIFYYIAVRMPLAYLLSYIGWGLNGIWVAVLISHIAASVASGCSILISSHRQITLPR